MVGGGVGYWWILSVVLRLDASVGLFSSVASPGMSSSLGHGGSQILGVNNPRLFTPFHEGGW
jgi:hypothetical protein